MYFFTSTIILFNFIYANIFNLILQILKVIQFISDVLNNQYLVAHMYQCLFLNCPLSPEAIVVYLLQVLKIFSDSYTDPDPLRISSTCLINVTCVNFLLTHNPLELFPPLTLSLLVSRIFFVPKCLILLLEGTLLCLSTTCSRLMIMSKSYIPTYTSSLVCSLVYKRGK